MLSGSETKLSKFGLEVIRSQLEVLCILFESLCAQLVLNIRVLALTKKHGGIQHPSALP